MKYLQGLLISCLFSLSLFAQDATLTKQETVNYLARKIKEVEGFQNCDPSMIGGGIKYHEFVSTSVSFDNSKNWLTIEYSATRCYDDNSKATINSRYSFNPLHIKVIDDRTVKKCPAQWVWIGLTGPTGKYHSQTVSSISIPYLKSDISDFNKISKALEHLKALIKAEDDPFGN